MITLDSVFRTAHGKLKGCEDYALCGKSNRFSYGIVADGCGSSEHATLGARLLALGVEREIKEYSAIYLPDIHDFDIYSLSTMILDAAKRVNTTMSSFGVTCPTDYMSTLLCMVCVKDCQDRERLTVCGFGDGGFFYKRKGCDDLLGLTFEFSNNAPYYPFYETYKNNYLEQVDYEGKEYVISKGKYTSRHSGDCVILSSGLTDISKLSTFVAHRKYFSYDLCYDDLDFALVTSDGIGSITGKPNEYDGWSAAKDIFDFKSMQGEFLQRRVNAHFKREEKAGCFHMDDFSAAGICFNIEV